MSAYKQRRPAVAGPGVEDRERIGSGAHQQSITAAEIAHALEAQRNGPGKWMARCVAHEDRTPSMSIADGDCGPLVYCFAGCSQDELIGALRERGLWRKPSVRARREIKRRDDERAQWRDTVKRLVSGDPLPAPPYTRALPKSGEVWIVIGPHAWETAKALQAHGRHCLVWPPGTPANAYRWPVAGRSVLVMDTADDLMPDEGWIAAAKDFAQLLVSRWGAASVRLFGDFEPTAYEPEEARHAA